MIQAVSLASDIILPFFTAQVEFSIFVIRSNRNYQNNAISSARRRPNLGTHRAVAAAAAAVLLNFTFPPATAGFGCEPGGTAQSRLRTTHEPDDRGPNGEGLYAIPPGSADTEYYTS